jgi:hypothetical protein
MALTGARARGTPEYKGVRPRGRSVNAIGRWTSPVEGPAVGLLRFAFDGLSSAQWGGRLEFCNLPGDSAQAMAKPEGLRRSARAEVQTRGSPMRFLRLEVKAPR